MPVKANIFSSRPYAFLAEKIAAAPSEIDFPPRQNRAHPLS